LSSRILEMLKDPVRKQSADMNDPTVKVVYETLYVDPAEQEAASMKNLMVVNQELENVLPKSDFVPFNPVAEFMKQQEAENKKNKKRKVKNEVWDDNKPYRSSNDNIEDALRAGVDHGDDADNTDDVKYSVPIPQSKSEKRREKKKNKSKKIVDKLKFWKTKRKHSPDPVLEEGEISEDDDVICLDDEPQMPTPPKRFKEMVAERNSSRDNARGGRNSFRGRDRDRGGNDNGNGGRGGKGNRRGKKSGFFNAFRKPEGRSVTYK